MRTKSLHSWLYLPLVCAAFSAHAQSSFQNLGFESANLPNLPAGQYGSLAGVASTNALPNWTIYLGTNQTTQVLQNNSTLGTASVSILGPNWTAVMGQGMIGGIIQGNYSVLLQAGHDPSSLGPVYVGASISQSGLIPTNAASMQFKVSDLSGYYSLALSFGGQSLPLVLLNTTSSYRLYGTDISPFSGQFGELKISAPTTLSPVNTYELDSIVFSTQPIPEPSSVVVFGIGALLHGFSRRRNSSR